jgi:hypothetical protein
MDLMRSRSQSSQKIEMPANAGHPVRGGYSIDHPAFSGILDYPPEPVIGRAFARPVGG